MKIQTRILSALLSFVVAASATMAVQAEDETPSEAPAEALSPLYKGAYVSPMGSGLFPDNDTDLDDGYGGILGLGYRSKFYAMEIAPTYGDQKPGTFQGVAVNGLLFPFSGLQNFYVTLGLSGIQYVKYQSPQQGKIRFNTLNLDPGLGYLLPLSVGDYEFAIRAEGRYRVGRREREYNDTDTDLDAPRRFREYIVNVGLYLPLGMKAPPPPPAPPAAVVPVAKACGDGADNDGDGLIDFPADPGCSSADDDDETDLPACSDGKDNDGDGAIDFPNDKGCTSADDNDETDMCRTPAPGERISLSGCGMGDVIVLHGVNFEFDRSKLTANAKTILDNVAEELKAYPGINVELGGHTDSKGSDEYNLQLSQARADSVRAYLVQSGIAEERLTDVGYGEAQPVADNETDEGRELNRRVELKIMEGSRQAPALPAANAEAPAAVEAAPEPSAEPAPEASGIEAIPPGEVVEFGGGQ